MTMAGAERANRVKGNGLVLLVLSAVVAVVYGRFLFNGYVYDDLYFIFENSALHDTGNWVQLLRHGDGYGMAGINPYYRPVTTLSFFLNAVIFKNSVFSFHLVNLLLHLATAAILYLVLRRGARQWIALAGALLFAIHPANAEPVGYISARADLLCGFFIASSYLFYLSYEESRKLRVLALSVMLMALGAFSKEVALMLPAALLLQAALQGKLAERWKTVAPFLLVVGLYFMAKVFTVEGFNWYQTPLYERIATAGVNLCTTIVATLFPVSQKVFYGAEIKKSLLDPDVLGSWLVVLSFAGAAVAMAKSRRTISFGLFWYLLMLFPVSGVVMLIYPSFVADRYIYIPLMGVAMAFCDFSEQVVASPFWQSHRRGLLAVSGLVIIALSLNTAMRSDVWRDDYSFWKKATENTPTNTLALSAYAAASMTTLRHEEAEKAFALALLLGEKTPATYSNYALHNAYTGNYDKALEYSRMALRLKPLDSFSLANHGVILMMKGDYIGALAYITKSLEMNPGNRTARNYLEDVKDMLAGGEE